VLGCSGEAHEILERRCAAAQQAGNARRRGGGGGDHRAVGEQGGRPCPLGARRLVRVLETCRLEEERSRQALTITQAAANE